jgi:hypothetical protein
MAYIFLKWYIKGHFGKYFIFFWLNTIFSIILFISSKRTDPEQERIENMTGAEYWEEKMRREIMINKLRGAR